MKKAITLTIISNMTANYGEGIGNISSVQKFYKNGKVYSIRTKESLKNALFSLSGFYDDLKTVVNGATQKLVTKDNTLKDCKSLEGGYMSTGTSSKKPKKKESAESEETTETIGNKKETFKRDSSIRISDAISLNEFNNETRFHNNLKMAQNFADANNLNLQKDAEKSGLMIYQYEFDKNLRMYSVMIDLENFGIDKNFNIELSKEEKVERLSEFLQAIETLYLNVKGSTDNAEPLLIFGGLTDRKTFIFENVVKFKDNKLLITDSLKEKLQDDSLKIGLMDDIFDNDKEIKEKLEPLSICNFFKELNEMIDKNFD